MTLRRATPLLLATLVLGGVWVGCKVTRSPANASPGAVIPSTKSPRGTVMPKMRQVLPLADLPAKTSRPAVAVASVLAQSATDLLAEQAALQLLVPEATLNLTSEQWTEFAALALHTQAVRHAYEATIATAQAAGPGQYRVEIPAYPMAGDALRAQFYAELRAKLGELAADDIVAQLGRSLEGHFAGFGVSVQTLDFSADQAGDDAGYQVVRTVKFWDSVQAGERLTTRRETHFPGFEDPSGHSWGPFLALIASRPGRNATIERG